ncbi:MAG: 50S ribosomal protein L30 [Candidatus Woesearchaeota archaeon]|nr:MAG: 50S ribosomal protein L30 [Candidatus Woesearchaeota archaeon]
MSEQVKKHRIAIIRVRGEVNVSQEIKDTLKMLRLFRKNYCTIISNTPHYLGMINKIRDYVTFGEISADSFSELLEKRGHISKKQKLTDKYVKEKTKKSIKDFSKDFIAFKKELNDIPGLKKFFRLHPPLKGFERAGIKKAYSVGGALGYRGDKINDLIQRMI